MSLATRCTACGTAFRVVQDQLKISEGWVRCGRCDAVFNALEGLFDLERAELHAQPPAIAPEHNASRGPPLDQATLPDDSLESAPAAGLRGETINRPLFQGALSGAQRALATSNGLSWSHSRTSLAEASSPTPEFLRQASTDSRQRSGRNQFVIWIVGATLLLVLTAQAAHHFRNSLSAHLVSVRPMLAAWCKSFSCAVGNLRRISDVAVENSALTRIGGGDAFTLAIVLHNRGRIAVALPSLELSLTDPNGQILSRRVLYPRDFNGPPVIAGGADTALKITLASDSLRTVGYTVEIFYP